MVSKGGSKKGGSKKSITWKGPKYYFGPKSIAYVVIRYTSSNLVFVVTDLRGSAVYMCCGGHAGMQSPKRKRSAWGAEQLASSLSKYALALRISSVYIMLSVPCKAFVFSAFRGFMSSGLNMAGISDQYNLPHNGCRISKCSSL